MTEKAKRRRSRLPEVLNAGEGAEAKVRPTRAKKTKTLSLADEQLIVSYLRDNPEFFIRHPGALDDLELPDPDKGTISLVEALQKRLRGEIEAMRERIRDMHRIADHNEELFRTFFGIYNDLYACTSLSQIEEVVNSACRNALYVPHTHIWINSAAAECRLKCDEKLVMNARDFADVCSAVMKGARVSLGKVNSFERDIIFPEDNLVYSRAIVRFGEDGMLGMLAFGHADLSHYHTGLDTTYIERLAGYISLLVPRFADLRQ